MKTRVIQDEPEPLTAAPALPPARPARKRRPLPMALGVVALVIAAALLASGAAALVALGARDADGYFTSNAHRLSTPSRALVSERLQIDTDAPDWVFGGSFATTRISATSDRPVFLGIGPAADVERYLGQVRHEEITDVDTNPFRVDSHLVPGTQQPPAPAGQGFWRVQASGPGTRTVTWPVKSGDWSVVVMNADGSPGVNVNARFGVRVPAVQWAGIGLLAGGVIALVGGALLVGRGTGRRRTAP